MPIYFCRFHTLRAMQAELIKSSKLWVLPRLRELDYSTVDVKQTEVRSLSTSELHKLTFADYQKRTSKHIQAQRDALWDYASYLDREWRPLRKQWVGAYLTANTRGVTTTNSVESSHSHLKQDCLRTVHPDRGRLDFVCD